MTLGELRAWVLRTVKRPELATQALDAINAAVESAATHGDFAWDLVEGTLAISATAYAQSIVISTSFTRFRKIKYLRPSGYTKYLSWRDPSRIFDEKGCERVNVWYRAGDNIVFKLSDLQSSMLYGYFTRPAFFTASQLNNTNNYLLHMPSVIHDLACARLWEDNGNEAEAQRLERRAMKWLIAQKSDKQDGVSYS